MILSALLFRSQPIHHPAATRSVRLMDKPPRISLSILDIDLAARRVEALSKNKRLEASLIKAIEDQKKVADKARRRHFSEKAREARRAKCDAVRNQTAENFIPGGAKSVAIYDYLKSVYPKWVTQADIMAGANVGKATLNSTIFFMEDRCHIERKYKVSKGNEHRRVGLYRIYLNLSKERIVGLEEAA